MTQPGIVRGYPNITGGRFARSAQGVARVLDAGTGAELLNVPMSRFGDVRLSPDGRFAVLDTWDTRASKFDVYDVESGSHVAVPGQASDYGWTADSDELFLVTEEGFTTCDAGTGECSSTAMDLEGSLELLRLGGRAWDPGQEI